MSASLAGGICLGDSGFAREVTWNEQAERLQNVSAAFLDNAPVGEPVRGGVGIELKTVISFLPKADPTIGGKSESVPTAPAHLVPTLQWNHELIEAKGGFGLAYQIWGGYLIPGGEHLLGLDAKLSQTAYGGALQPELDLGSWKLYLPLGYQSTHAHIVGAITQKKANDKFDVTTTSSFAAFGGKHAATGLWFNLLGGHKQSDTSFDIEVDQTHLATDDARTFEEASLGWQGDSGIELGYSQIYIPERLTMPRFLAGYQYTF